MELFNIFISYSHDDQMWVNEFKRLLEQNKQYYIWIDKDNLRGGEAWETEIRKAVERYDCFLFVLTPKSCESDYCNLELEYARKSEKMVVPLMLKQCEIPPQLSDLQVEIASKNVLETVLTIERALCSLRIKTLTENARKIVYTRDFNFNTDYTTTSTRFADIDSTALVLEEAGRNLLVGFRGVVSNPYTKGYFNINIDGKSYGGENGVYELDPHENNTVSFVEPLTGLEPKKKKISLQWRVDESTITLRSNSIKFWVQKMP